MPRYVMKVPIGRQHGQAVPYAKLRQKSVNSSHLYASAAAGISQSGRFYVVAFIRDEKSQAGEPLDKSGTLFWSAHALQHLL